MRRSFGSGGSGMGGGNSGGGGMLRTVQRAVRAGVGGAPAEPFSSSSANSTTIGGSNSRKATNFNKKNSNQPNTALTLSIGDGGNDNSNSGSSAFSTLINFSVSANSGAAAPAWGSCSSSEDLDWERVDGSDDERVRVFYEDFVFGTAPSNDEVHHAFSSLQQVLGTSCNEGVPKRKLGEELGKDFADGVASPTSPYNKMSSIEPEIDWVEPSLQLCDSRTLQACGSDRVYDAFHLLQTEPSVQRMVISLSSDKAVWDAVLNNEAVKELRGSIEADKEVGENRDDDSGDSNLVKVIMSWVFVNAKVKIMKLIDKITKLMNEVFHLENEEKKEGTTNPFEEKMKTSLFLSVIVLLIVVITRVQSA